VRCVVAETVVVDRLGQLGLVDDGFESTCLRNEEPMKSGGCGYEKRPGFCFAHSSNSAEDCGTLAAGVRAKS
jgi:hypothetical protein